MDEQHITRDVRYCLVYLVSRILQSASPPRHSVFSYCVVAQPVSSTRERGRIITTAADIYIMYLRYLSTQVCVCTEICMSEEAE